MPFLSPINYWASFYATHMLPTCYPHIGEIRTKIVVYKQAGVIKHIEAPAINKVELLDL